MLKINFINRVENFKLGSIPYEHIMFKLDIKNWDDMCFDYLKKIRYLNYLIESREEHIITKSLLSFILYLMS
jgi:hypothetical protein